MLIRLTKLVAYYTVASGKLYSMGNIEKGSPLTIDQKRVVWRIRGVRGRKRFVRFGFTPESKLGDYFILSSDLARAWVKVDEPKK